MAILAQICLENDKLKTTTFVLCYSVSLRKDDWVTVGVMLLLAIQLITKLGCNNIDS